MNSVFKINHKQKISKFKIMTIITLVLTILCFWLSFAAINFSTNMVALDGIIERNFEQKVSIYLGFILIVIFIFSSLILFIITIVLQIIFLVKFKKQQKGNILKASIILYYVIFSLISIVMLLKLILNLELILLDLHIISFIGLLVFYIVLHKQMLINFS